MEEEITQARQRRAIETCNNLQQTIDKMGEFKPIESDHMAGFRPRASKEWLINRRRDIIKKFNLNKKDLKTWQ